MIQKNEIYYSGTKYVKIKNVIRYLNKPYVVCLPLIDKDKDTLNKPYMYLILEKEFLSVFPYRYFRKGER